LVAKNKKREQFQHRFGERGTIPERMVPVPFCCAKLGQSPAVLKKKSVRAGAEKSLESATECGKVDAGRAAPRELSLALSQLSVALPRAQKPRLAPFG
jgi:hypothetical protein